MSTMTLDPTAADLKARWTPSEEQVADATEYLAQHDSLKHAYTVHLLVGKNYGWWTTDVEVVPVPGVFASRNEAIGTNLDALVNAKAAETGKPVTGGYTSHYIHEGEPGWAVWEDCLAVANQEA